LWNKVLGLNLECFKNNPPLLWYYKADFWTKYWKASNEYGFLANIPAHCLQQKLKDLNNAFKDAFDRKQPLKKIPKLLIRIIARLNHCLCVLPAVTRRMLIVTQQRIF
jgi:transposase